VGCSSPIHCCCQLFEAAVCQLPATTSLINVPYEAAIMSFGLHVSGKHRRQKPALQLVLYCKVLYLLVLVEFPEG